MWGIRILDTNQSVIVNEKWASLSVVKSGSVGDLATETRQGNFGEIGVFSTSWDFNAHPIAFVAVRMNQTMSTSFSDWNPWIHAAVPSIQNGDVRFLTGDSEKSELDFDWAIFGYQSVTPSGYGLAVYDAAGNVVYNSSQLYMGARQNLEVEMGSDIPAYDPLGDSQPKFASFPHSIDAPWMLLPTGTFDTPNLGPGTNPTYATYWNNADPNRIWARNDCTSNENGAKISVTLIRDPFNL